MEGGKGAFVYLDIFSWAQVRILYYTPGVMCSVLFFILAKCEVAWERQVDTTIKYRTSFFLPIVLAPVEGELLYGLPC